MGFTQVGLLCVDALKGEDWLTSGCSSHISPPLYCPSLRLCSFIVHLGENLGDWGVIFWFHLWNYDALLWGSFALMENKSH